jgi:hypothetical protein
VNLNKRLFSVAAATAVATGALVSIGSGAAQAAPSLGTLTITPATGIENTGLTGTLSGSCPADSTGQNGFISGPGITGEAVIDSNRPPASTFSFSGTLLDVFQGAGIAAPNGTYTVRIACIGTDFFTETGEFTQQLTVTPRTGSASTANYATVVPAQNTTVTLAQNTASGSFGDSVTFTADATDGVAGTVQFKDGAGNLGTPQTVNALGVASFTTTTLAVGTHPITAVFTPTDTAAYNASTSNGVSHVVNAVATSLLLSSNTPTAAFAPANFTATVSPAVAGTVTFTVDGTPTSPIAVDGSGVATYSTAGLGVGAHTVSAHFTPGAGTGADPADATPVTHNVTAFAGASLTENITVAVPTGALTIVLDDGADGNVDLGTAQMNAGGDLLTASGQMDVVKVTDTRAGDPGWTASGIVSDFSNGTDTVSRYNLGWAPTIVSSAANQVGIAAGPSVTAGSEGNASTTPSDPAVGLGASRVLAVAQDNAGNGTARLGASLDLNIPTDVSSGTYAATLTLTVI